ncbi:hypothetical protein Desku_1426 [Desulfofundulus kuznetsovii DSM 6115]|jgi:hypothetical protein|uniref:Uncharacterized protein n=1 Tax=Desulfofundulus kuznetsovii (strain DSM 6115 / VKM B-1805 / 17) TaxID=760568 RepID=A0AAU8PVA0_DESK7|nr:hypothetical protein Desku_1426 [Desulfofundulus kuznetsovii DSM 6115]
MISGGQSAESQRRPEASRGAVGAEHWSERGQRRIQPGSLNIYTDFIYHRLFLFLYEYNPGDNKKTAIW